MLLARSKFPTFRRAVLVFLLALSAVVAVTLRGATASGTQSGLVTISPATQSRDAGTVQTFTVAISCAGAASAQCGPNVQVTIPLDTSTSPSMVDAAWTYSATSGSTGLITSGPTVTGNDLVIGIDAAQFVSGYSGTIRLNVTPPNIVTPNNTTYTLTPVLSGDSFPTVYAPAPAVATVTSKPAVSIVNATSDGGSIYEPGVNFGFTATVGCSTTGTGSLQATAGVVTQQIPTGVTYVSSSPAGSYNSGTRTITWTLTSAAAMPPGCGPTAAGTDKYQVTVTGPPSVPNVQPLTARATFNATGPDATVPAGVSASTAASVGVNFIRTIPIGPGVGYPTLFKTSIAPLAQHGVVSDNDYVGTYPGDWVPLAALPQYVPGAAAASYQSMVTSSITNKYMIKLIDPVPCLDSHVGNRYSSKSYLESHCNDPAFITQMVLVRNAGSDPTVNGVGAAVAAGWTPQATLNDGSVISLAATGAHPVTAKELYFAVPAGKKVATITLPPNMLMRNRNLQLIMFGYAAPALLNLNGGLNDLRNTTTAIPYLAANTPLVPQQWSVSLATVPRIPSLGVSTSFGPTGAGPAGTTTMQIVGAVNLPFVPLVSDVVMTDLLPLGITWKNTASSTTVTLLRGVGATPTTVTASLTYINNYLGSGRQLIRMTVPKEAFTAAGSWKLTPAATTFQMNTPSDLGVYQNKVQIFLFNHAPLQITSSCTTPTQVAAGISTAIFLSNNEQDLAGDGKVTEQFCQNTASLAVTSVGAAFSLTKSVKGALDTVTKGALGVGLTGPKGPGVFTLDWNNVGSDTLKNVVIYDILPYVGDGGVSAGQVATARLSEMRALLTSVVVPSGVTVEYSQSINPCRPEVYANVANALCVNDWTSTAPTDMTTVRSIRFESPATYARGEGFSIALHVTLAASQSGEIAWNSAATNATDASHPATIPLPAEPPKVGLRALPEPTITTQSSQNSAYLGDSLSDQITISDLPAGGGTLSWALRGPVAPVGGSCQNLDWSNATVIDSGSTTLIADGTFTTNQAQPTELGCYTWTASLAVEIIPGTPSTVTSEAGIESETFLVAPVPTLPRTGSQPIIYVLSAIAFMALGLALMGWSRRLRRA